MAKNIGVVDETTATFQTWLNKTNQIAGLVGSSILTADSGTAAGDSTTGNLTLVGDITLEGLYSNELTTDSIGSTTAATTIGFSAPIQIVGTSATCASFSYGAGGGRTVYTDSTISWTVGMKDSNPGNFTIYAGTGATPVEISTAGLLTVPSLAVQGNVTVGDGDDTVTIDGALTVTGAITAGSIAGFTTANVPEGAGATSDNGQQYFTRARAHSAFVDGDGITFTDTNGNKEISLNYTEVATGISLSNYATTTALSNYALLTATSKQTFADDIEADIITGATELRSEDGIKLEYDDANGHGYLTPVGVNHAWKMGVRHSGTSVDYAELSQSAFKIKATNGLMAQDCNISLRDGTDTKISLFHSSGSIIAEGDITAYGTASDINLKENINVIENALDKITEIRGVTFAYKDKPKEIMTGLIAQEVEKVLPGVVYKVEQNGHSHKALRYGNVVGLLVEAIKELTQKVNDLENKCSCNSEQK